MSDDKKKMYYGGMEKTAIQTREDAERVIEPFTFRDIQRDFDRMIDRFEREFDDFWDIPSRMKHGMRWRQGVPMPLRESMMPSVDLEDRGKDYRLTVDLPGFKKEDVELEVADDSLAIHAKKNQAKEEKDKNYVRKERSAQTFYRQIPFPQKILADEAKANLNNGILEITLPKKEQKEKKKLTITEEGKNA